MVAPARLIIDDCNKTSCTSTERVLGGSIGHPSSRKRRNVGRGIIRASFHLVEGSTISAVESTSGAMRCDARSASRRINITGPSSNKRACGQKSQSERMGSVRGCLRNHFECVPVSATPRITTAEDLDYMYKLT